MKVKLLFFTLLLVAISTYAQPANNDCADAETISVTTTGTTLVSFNNATATQSLLSSCDTSATSMCENIPTVEISTTQGNTTELVPILDTSNTIVAALNANNLGTITTTLFIDNADTRDFSGQPYLRREVSISAQNLLSSTVNVRLYASGDEVDDLILAIVIYSS